MMATSGKFVKRHTPAHTHVEYDVSKPRFGEFYSAPSPLDCDLILYALL